MKNIISLLLLAGALAGGGWLIYFGPYYMDVYTMQEVAETSVLTAAAFGTARGTQELDHQLERRGIDYITGEHCKVAEKAGEFHCDCTWQVDVYPPLIGGRRLSHEVHAAAGKDQRLVKD
jgi:hypothetical protein